jgi:hypothetical protein
MSIALHRISLFSRSDSNTKIVHDMAPPICSAHHAALRIARRRRKGVQMCITDVLHVCLPLSSQAWDDSGKGIHPKVLRHGFKISMCMSSWCHNDKRD